MEARDPDTGEAMTETLLRDESITMFFAGHETTARTMAAAWYALATHPEVAARLHEELDSVLGDQAPTLEELHYTLQVVKEVLRLYPAAPWPPAARDPRATLPPAPARWIRSALRHARHAEHRGRPASRDQSSPRRPRPLSVNREERS